MVNLLKFKEKAEYEDGRETALTGREAYEVYEQGVKKLLDRIGGGIGFEAYVERLMLGEVEELWDVVALAVWPSRQGRPKVSLMITATSTPSSANRSRNRRADASESFGRTSTRPCAPLDDWSTPEFAQQNP